MMYMGFGGLLNQLATTTAGGGMGAVVENYPVASGNSISAGDVVDVSGGQVVGNKVPLSSLSVGTIIQLNENGSPVDFYVAQHNYESDLNGSGRTLLVRKDAAALRIWDNNSSQWATSDIRGWLNSTYLNRFSSDLRASIGTTVYEYTPSRTEQKTTRSDAVFLLSINELSYSASTYRSSSEGVSLSFGTSLRSVNYNGGAVGQWTRSINMNNNGYAMALDSTPSVRYVQVNVGGYYARPVFTLPGTYTISTEVTQSQAIALQSGTAGQTIPVCYSGIVKAPFVSQGDVISSSGVTGVGILDGVLQVYAKDAPGKIVTGSYVGNGNYTVNNPNSISFYDRPKLVIIQARLSSTENACVFFNTLSMATNYYNCLCDGWASDANSITNSRFYVKFENNNMTWYSELNAKQQLNQDNITYNYIAFF